MQYPIFIHKDHDSDYGVIVPDLPGCFSAGNSVAEAIQNAHEAIECHLEGLLADNQTIPLRKSLEEHINNPDFAGGVLALIDVNFSKISDKTIQIRVSFPELFLKQIDDYVHRQGADLSQFLIDAAESYMSEHPV